jgi:hypothetical protein
VQSPPDVPASSASSRTSKNRKLLAIGCERLSGSCFVQLVPEDIFQDVRFLPFATEGKTTKNRLHIDIQVIDRSITRFALPSSVSFEGSSGAKKAMINFQ